jgi:hypothetical protein
MKKNAHAFVNPFLICLLVTIAFGGSVGVGLVWVRHQISVTANENRRLLTQIDEIDRKILETQSLVESAESPALMRKLNDEMHLGLVLMSDPRVHVDHVTESPIDRLVVRANSEVFTDRAPAAVTFQFAQR